MNAPIDISGVTLTTPRLTLRPWRLSDLEDLYAYASVDGVGQMAGWLPHGSIEDSRGILRMFIEQKKTFALEYQGRVVGSLGIEEYDEALYPEFRDVRARELGFVLAKDCWGRGLMPEAVNAALRYLFEDVGLEMVFCGHFLSNGRSARVQQKCGFRHYAFDTFRTQYGTVEQDEFSALSREEWLARRDETSPSGVGSERE